ncbi:MAG: hypothetical protein M1827_000850 [Pycnora praestabilis]|nr:MAG: hypothetical protein M1827_000850 [Pycnora praestabilis]
MPADAADTPWDNSSRERFAGSPVSRTTGQYDEYCNCLRDGRARDFQLEAAEMSSIEDRRDKQIWDAIEGDNFKQALQLCQKRLKKGEKGHYFLALKAYVLTQSAASKQNEEGFAELKNLAVQEPPITDINTLQLLQRGLTGIEGAQPEVRSCSSTLWERAIKASPKDEELSKAWFFLALRQNEWKAAQKAAMNLQKSFPKKRDYYFWAILSCSLIQYRSEAASDTDRKLFGTLAYRMISKAASDVPTDPQSLMSPGRAIQTPQELHLLISILLRQGCAEDALAILNSENLGVWSTVAKGDWGLVRKKLEILERQKLWLEEWEFCKELLDRAYGGTANPSNESEASPPDAKGDDWRIWQGLLTASRELNCFATYEATRSIINVCAQQPRPSRNAQLAVLDFVKLRLLMPVAMPSSSSELLAVCCGYFEKTASKTCCFDDLRTYVEYLTESEKAECLWRMQRYVASKKDEEVRDEECQLTWTTSAINVLKFEYLLTISVEDSKASEISLSAFVTSCIKLYQSSLSLGAHLLSTDNQPGDDACILGAMALLHLSELRSHPSSAVQSRVVLLQTVALLEFGLSYSQHNYQILLLLVRLYIIIGAPSSALEIYPRLSIKQIQFDTMSHNLFTRISTMHPYAVAATAAPSFDKADRDPKRALEKALRFYEKARSQLPELKKLALENGSYEQVEGFLQFEQTLQTSLCMLMWKVEKQQIAQMVVPKGANPATIERQYLNTDSLPQELSDNRDYDVLANFEASGRPQFETYLCAGPRPKSRWLDAALLSERVFTALTALTTGASSDQEYLHLPPNHRITPYDGTQADELTPAEMESTIAMESLAAIIATTFHSRSNGEPNRADQELQTIERYLSSRLEDLQKADDIMKIATLNLDSTLTHVGWQFLHNSFTTLRMLKAISMFLSFATPRSKSSKPMVEKAGMNQLYKLIDEVYQGIRSATSRLKNQFSEAGVVGSFVDAVFERDHVEAGVVSNSLEDLVSEPWMETFASKVIQSWQEALDGVLLVSIKD